MKRIFFVEDDLSLINGLSFAIKKQGYETDIARTYLEAEKMWINGKYDLVILDVSLPDGSGYDLCKNIRKTSKVPIIFLTAADEETDIIMGLDIGGDDYITKPFNILELKARIKAILRRSVKKAPTETQEKKVLKARDLELSFDSRRVFISGKEVNLTAKEFDLLELLMENPGKVYSREKLLDTVWGYDYPGDVRTVDVHVRRLREKIEVNPSEPKYIFTKWGVGYYFN